MRAWTTASRVRRTSSICRRVHRRSTARRLKPGARRRLRCAAPSPLIFWSTGFVQAMASALLRLVGPPGFASRLEKSTVGHSEPDDGPTDFGFRRVDPEHLPAAGPSGSATSYGEKAAAATGVERQARAHHGCASFLLRIGCPPALISSRRGPLTAALPNPRRGSSGSSCGSSRRGFRRRSRSRRRGARLLGAGTPGWPRCTRRWRAPRGSRSCSGRTGRRLGAQLLPVPDPSGMRRVSSALPPATFLTARAVAVTTASLSLPGGASCTRRQTWGSGTPALRCGRGGWSV